MTPSIEAKIVVIEEETGIGANTKLRIGEVLREIANEKPYKVYTAILTQTGTDDPVVVELENTLGNIVWTRLGIGQYNATTINLFTANKTFLTIQGSNDGDTSAAYVKDKLYKVDENNLSCITVDGVNTRSDGFLNNTSIEIRVYN